MTMEEESKNVYWRNAAYHNMTKTVFESYTNSTEYDVTLVCDDFQELKAHQIVLSAASPFLRNIFSSVSAEPIDIFLPCFKYDNLYSLLELINKGSTTVSHRDLSTIIKTAEDLDINI